MTKKENLTNRQLTRYAEIAGAAQGNGHALAAAIADKMRRGLKGRFDGDIVKLRRRAEEMKKAGVGDTEALGVVLEAIEIAIKGKRESSHIKRRTRVHSKESAEFRNKKDAVDKALADASVIIVRGIADDGEYCFLTELRHDLDALLKAISTNGEFSKKAASDMQAGYRNRIPAINSARRAYLEKTHRKHSDIIGK